MTYKQKFDSLDRIDDWLSRAIVIAVWHHERKKEARKHSVAKTADYFDVSSAYVSESIAIYQHKKHIKDAPSRNRAIKIIRGIL